MSSPVKSIHFCVLLALAGSVLPACSKNYSPSPPSTVAATTPAAAHKDSQVIELTANFGYTPALIHARAGLPAVLKVKTSDTTDCSVELRIPVLGLAATLPATGETTFEIPAQPPGSTLEGACQMGMNHFVIEFD